MPNQQDHPTCRREFLRGSLSGLGGLTALTVTSQPSAAGRDVTATPQEQAKALLAEYQTQWLPRETAAAEADWAALTDVTEAHTAAQVTARQALNVAVGSPKVIESTRGLLKQRDQLDDSTVRQLEKILLRAAESPGTVPEVVKARTEAEARQSADQDGFTYVLKRPGQSDQTLTANDIDRILVRSRDLNERKTTWELSKTIGGRLRPGLIRLRELRNQVAQALGYDSFFALQVADYGLTTMEMLDLCESIVTDVKPLYEQLHTWAKHELARRYQTEPPKGKLPAHWLPNRWAQNWPGLVEGVDLDAPFQGKTKEYVVEQAERFYVSLGFPRLPKSFYTKSDLYPAPAGGNRRKNSHASAWHINLADDVRSLMSVEPNAYWFNTAHHELGHIYYYLSYSRPEVPYLLRAGANRAFHEGIGDLIGLAAGQKKYLKSVGLLPDSAEKADPVSWLLDAALDGASLVFIPFAAGVMTRFEHDFYAGQIPDQHLNAAWWELAAKYQGITPPGARPEDSTCDPATKTHINDDAGQYYDYAIGTVIKFQLHDHIAREILKDDPRDCNYYGNAQVGGFLADILRLGATRDWNAVLREATGQGLSAKPMVAYFEPLLAWLREQNRDRKVGWVEA